MSRWPHRTQLGLIEHGVRHFVAATAVAAVLAYIAVYATLIDLPIRSDGYSYYVYLPSWLIYHDVSFEALGREWYGGTYPEFSAIRRWPSTGRWLNPHPIGTAILMSPFFGVSHLLTHWSNLPPDGFSFYYQHGAGLAGLAYFLAGLAILRRILMRHFSPGVVLATLVCITWGTNLFHYGVFDATFSHAFAFFLICAWLALVERWWEAPTMRRSLGLGVVAALIVLTRHTNALFLILLPLYGVTRLRDVRARIEELWRRRAVLGVAALVAAALAVPQFALYRWITGSWYANPYGGLGVGFTFGSPHLAGVLFGTEKGLFFWSPILLLAVVGFVVADRWARQIALTTAIVAIIEVYLVASWYDWQFGASFGHRAFTDGLALAAPFIASCFVWAARAPRLGRVVAVFAACAVILSVAQMIQYWIGILPMADTTWTQYRALFLRFR